MKKLEKTLDKKQILCYNKDVPRGKGRILMEHGNSCGKLMNLDQKI